MGIRTCVAAAVVLLASCSPPQRFSDGELYLIAADYVATHDKIVATHRTEGNRYYTERYAQIPYEDGADLIRQNPDCCFLGVTPTDDPVPTCRFGARPAYIVSVHYRARYWQSPDFAASKMMTRNIGIDRRGVACNTLED